MIGLRISFVKSLYKYLTLDGLAKCTEEWKSSEITKKCGKYVPLKA
jgi:hypothetical protein